MSDKVKEYAREKIKQIALIQDDLDALKGSQKDGVIEALSSMHANLVLGSAICFLQELITVYESILKGNWKNDF